MKKTSINLNLYEGSGIPISKRNQQLPACQWISEKPETYHASDGLRKAVNVAISLGQPLLITGEPGTGKTQLAYSVAHELELSLFKFHTQTTSVAKDLFYVYDTLHHFQDARTQNNLIKDKYVTYNAFGQAILLACSPDRCQIFEENEKEYIPEALEQQSSRSVVLIDEIDKAPRDLPNDILNDILTMSFTVKETDKTFQADDAFRPIIILTSNSEKNLPEPFLRRCVFYHIDFPDNKRLETIIKNHMGQLSDFMENLLPGAIAQFQKIRDEMNLRKKPATAECIAWLTLLEQLFETDQSIDFNNLTPEQADILSLSYSVIAKCKEDHDRLTLEHPEEPVS